MVMCLLIGGAIGVALATPSPSQTAIGGVWQEEKPCTFYVFTDGTYYYAQNCDTGAITYGGSGNAGGATGTSLSSVLNLAVAANEQIAFGSGTFVIDAALSYSVNNVQWKGQGSTTNFTLAASFNTIPITVSGSNWLVTQMRFDARNLVYGNSWPTLKFSGSNDTVSFSYFNKGDHGQILLEGMGGQALDNVVTNSYDDGIIIELSNYNLVQGNLVYKTTNHNCISIVGITTGNEVIGNTCKNSGSYGIAIENQNGGGTGPNYDVLISGNTVYRSAEEGIVVYEACAYQSTVADTATCPTAPPYVPAAVNATISDNIVSYAAFQCPAGSPSTCLPSGSTPGIGIYSGRQVTVVNNQIIRPANDGIDLGNVSQISIENNQITQPGANGIDFPSCTLSGCQTSPLCTTCQTFISALVTGNTITSPLQDGIQLAGTEPDIVVSSNTIVSFASTHAGIAISGASACVISSNSITPAASYTSGTDGMYFTGTASNDCVVTSNALYGGASGGSSGIAIYINDGSTGLVISNNDVDSWATGIQGASTENYNTIVDNVIRTSVTTKVSVVGANDIVEGNVGYNPVASATFTAGASPYTYTNADHYTENVVLTTVGGISALTCNGIAGWAITLGSTCTLWPGQTMAITWSTTAPVFTKIDIS